MHISQFFEPGTPAAILSWGQLGTSLAKTTYGLLRHSRVLKPVCVIAEQEGKQISDFVSPVRFNVPIVNDVDKAVRLGARVLVIGISNVGGYLPDELVRHILKAIEYGLDVVSGLHLRLSEIEPFLSASKLTKSRIIDVRHYDGKLRIFNGQILKSKILRVCVLGTDCATGKRTTAIQLWEAALKRNLPAAFLATGQTGIMIGADEGVAIDALAADFVPGVVEGLILKLEQKGNRIVFIEGQGALRHLAYGQVTLGLIYGCMPQYVVMVHEPRRKKFEFFEDFPLVPDPVKEIQLIQQLVGSEVLGVSCLDRDYKLDGYFVFDPFDEKQLSKIISKLEVAL
ncbi:DUF1611 domain-containing protein [Thermotoga profunda]|uniref:DUF1611 domain-containing protein n=1 Tax=Thermotoga profunda TaxID=1508420 RepID=UPI000597B900|nr:DUF1611 domain-containing protein [Thermotoga profunda]